MNRWHIQTGNILDVPADVLVCSGNPFLTLSGGVGGAFAERHGRGMQGELDAWLAASGKRWTPRGTVVRTGAHGGPYAFVLHAVAVDGMYESSVEVVTGVVRECLSVCREAGARRVALAALATGYGHLSPGDFGRALRPLVREDLGVERVTVGVRSEADAEAVRAGVGVGVGGAGPR